MKHWNKEKISRKNFSRRWKNRILKALTFFASITFFVAGSALDSEDFVIPSVIALVSVAWLALFVVANGGDLE